MKALLVTALKVLILLVLAAAAAIGGVMFADYEGWPRWTVAVAAAGLLFIIVAVLLVRRYYYRRREEKFVKRVVEQDLQAIGAAPIHERRNLLELQERWTAAVNTLRSSRLGHRGDPLYTLPWFMIFGETSSGKTTAVSHARLKTILTEAGPARGIAGTRNCDWWFFDKAVILDTAGRYAVPLENEDGKEWERFLQLLARYRRKEPLNGLIVTLPADRLLAGDTDALEEYGRSIRLRLDQLMRVLGAAFPVYILVTKLDLVMGMTALAELLPENRRGQALGLLNDSERRSPEEFLREALGHVSRRLKDLRLLLAPGAENSGGRAMLFPDEFEGLSPLIQAFVKGAFHENPYQETPFLRGFFMSSGRQSGLTRSGVLASLESLKGREWRLPDTGRGLFLHDFFDAILPRDRQGFRMLGEYLSWRSATANLALAAWLLLLLTGIGLSSLSYMQTRSALEPVKSVFVKQPKLGAGLEQDMVTLGLLRDRIAETEKRLHSRATLPMGLHQGRQAMAHLKRSYTSWFRTFVLSPADKAMSDLFASQDRRTGTETMMAPYLEHLLWRMETIRSLQEGRPRQKSTEDQDAAPLQALALAFGGELPFVAAFFTDMYRSYVLWEEEGGLLDREYREMQFWAHRIVQRDGADLHWIVEWANGRTDLAPVSLRQFWTGLGQVGQAPLVPGAFTGRGAAAIETMLERITRLDLEPDIFIKHVDDFRHWYGREFFSHWLAFANDFGRGMEVLMTRDDWLKTGASMATLDNPYFRLIGRIRDEFAAVEEVLPDTSIRRIARSLEFIEQSFRAGQTKASLEGIIAKKIHELEAAMERLEESLAAAADFAEYMEQLDAFLPATATMDSAYRFSIQNYGSSGDDHSPVDLALAALNRIRPAFEKDYGTLEDPFWNLIKGPLFFLVTLTTYETACGVNELWQAQVAADAKSIPQRELWMSLFGEKGSVRKFVEGPAKPFLERRPDGWRADAWIDVPFPVHRDFLRFLNQGWARRQEIRPSYAVTVSTLPTNVNREAAGEPYQTSLKLECHPESQILDNFNYPVSLDFTWEPGRCSDVTMSIFFRETTLVKTWPGESGFREFLKEFRQGRRTYSPDDFPRQTKILEGLGIRDINVAYILKNADPVLAIGDYEPLSVPADAAHCWFGLGIGALYRNGQPGGSAPAAPGRSTRP